MLRVNPKSSLLEFACFNIWNMLLLYFNIIYGNEMILWMEKGISMVRAVHKDNLRGLRRTKRIDGIPNTCVEWKD